MSQKTTHKDNNKPTAVTFFKQAVRNFVTPYGAAADAPSPSKIYPRLKPFTCEWLTRPKVALSEYADTIMSNLKILEKTKNDVASSKIVKRLNEHFADIIPNLEALNNKTENQATPSDVKKIIRSLVKDNDEMDDAMDEIFHISNAMFTLSTNYIIARSLLRHPKEYAQLIEGFDIASATFKKKASAETMKCYLYKDYKGSKTEVTRKASKSVQQAMESSSSGDDSTTMTSSSSNESTRKLRKKNKRKQQQSEPESDEPAKKLPKKKKETTKKDTKKSKKRRVRQVSSDDSEDTTTTSSSCSSSSNHNQTKPKPAKPQEASTGKSKGKKSEMKNDSETKQKNAEKAPEQPDPATSTVPDNLDKKTKKTKKTKTGNQ